jgi:putative membrane protein
MELSSYYLVFKSIHVIGIISWMAGLLYFYRLFVYHFNFGKDNSVHALLTLMEKRLFKYITVPAMLVSVAAGLLMIHLNPGLMTQRWFQVKIVAAFFMITVTFHGITPIRRFREKKFNKYSNVGLRLMNEVPTLLMILIVIMAIMRPF